MNQIINTQDQKATRYTLHATRNQAFGLIEVIVSTSIILIVAGAALGLGRLALKNSVISYERTQAYNLAREAMETVRNQRDYEWNQSRSSQFGSDLISSINSLGIAKTTDELEKTEFNRTVTGTLLSSEIVKKINDIVTDSGGSSVPITEEFGSEITVKVSWNSYGKERNVTLITTLTDWKPADYGW